MNINYQAVLTEIGGVASDTTDYTTIKATWDSSASSTSKCPPFFVFVDTWRQLVYSGKETGTWREEREKAYIAEGLTLNKINDLLMEYNLAVVSGTQATITKYETELEAIQAKREAIKAQFPKTESEG